MRFDPTSPAVLLRVEGGIMMLGSILLYARGGGGWLPFVVFFLAPDLSLVGYLFGTRVGAVTYNLGHAYPLPALTVATGLYGDAPWLVLAGLIWFAHVGMDRLIGFGLKYPGGFFETHLGRV